MGFGIEFNKSFRIGVPLGLKSFLNTKDTEAKNARELEKLRLAKAKEVEQTMAMSQLIGVETYTDDVGKVKLDIPDDFEFSGASDADRLNFLPDVGNSFQAVFKQLDKENQEEDFFVNKRTEFNNETGEGGIVTAIDKRTGDRVTIGTDRNYRKKIVDETMFENVIKIDGKSVGIKGKRSKLIQYEGGTFDVIEGVSKIKGNTQSEEEELFDGKLARIHVAKQKALEKVDGYLRGKYATEQTRDLKRQRINSDLEVVAQDYYNLGSDEAREVMDEISIEGRNTIGKGFVGHPVSRKDFYERKIAEIQAEYENNGHYNDFLSIVQFLQAKYRDFVVSQDPVLDKDELNFILPPLKTEN